MRHVYNLQVFFMGKWVDWTGGQCSREYGMGYIASHREGPTPRCGIRLIREDGKVIDEVAEYNEVGIGMIAGWPTWGQYAAAAQRALATAARIAERHKEFAVAAELSRVAVLTEHILKVEERDG